MGDEWAEFAETAVLLVLAVAGIWLATAGMEAYAMVLILAAAIGYVLRNDARDES